MSSPAELRLRGRFLFAAVLLVAAFFSLDETSSGLEIRYAGLWDFFSPGELQFWLASALFLTPAGIFAGLGIAPRLGPVIERLAARLAGLDRRQAVALVIGFGVVAACVARLGHQLVLAGLPFTDDEWATRFGGQILASGQLTAPIPPARELFFDVYLFESGGRWTSFDFLGSLLPWALAELTGTGGLLFHLLAGAGVAAVAVAAGRRFGPVWGAAAGLLIFFSPMAMTMSWTTHGQLVSRSLLALGLAPLLWARTISPRAAVLAGLALGLAVLARPIEVTFLCVPLAIVFAIRAWREPELRRALALAVALLIGLQLMAVVYHLASSGSPLPLRFSGANEIENMLAPAHQGFGLSALWSRFGYNVSYNLLALAVCFLGPLGLLLVAAGAAVDRTTIALSVGVGLHLLVALLHDNRGLHCVGPIHYSEAAVPLALVATAGLRRLVRWLEGTGVPRATSASVLVAYLIVPLLLFTMWNAAPLRRQATLQEDIYAAFESDVVRRPAVLLTPQLGAVWRSDPSLRSGGSWVFSWRRARPDRSEPILILADGKNAARLAAAAFPDRSIYRLIRNRGTLEAVMIQGPSQP